MSLTLIRTVGLGTAIVLGAAACGGDADTTDAASNAVATLDDGTETSETSSSDSAAADDTAVSDAEAPDDPELAFALWDECMADAGFDISSSFAGDGEGDGIAVEDVELDATDPQSDGFSSPEDFDDSFQEASAECDKHLANVDAGFDLSPEQQAQFEDAQIEWAACMAEAGFEIPDIEGDGAALSIQIGPDESDPQSQGFGEGDFDFEAFEEAAESCDSAFDELNDVFGDESSEG